MDVQTLSNVPKLVSVGQEIEPQQILELEFYQWTYSNEVNFHQFSCKAHIPQTIRNPEIVSLWNASSP